MKRRELTLLTVPPHSLRVLTQQTPNPLAQLPLFMPLMSLHSVLDKQVPISPLRAPPSSFSVARHARLGKLTTLKMDRTPVRKETIQSHIWVRRIDIYDFSGLDFKGEYFGTNQRLFLK